MTRISISYSSPSPNWWGWVSVVDTVLSERISRTILTGDILRVLPNLDSGDWSGFCNTLNEHIKDGNIYDNTDNLVRCFDDIERLILTVEQSIYDIGDGEEVPELDTSLSILCKS